MKAAITHGGSGSGVTSWAKWASGCLIASDLYSQEPEKCGGATLIGTMLHKYLEHYFLGHIQPGERLEFVDEKCGGVPTDEQNEAYRVWTAYPGHPNAIDPTEYEIIGTEILVTQGLAEYIGFSGPLTAQVDLVTYHPDHGYEAWDHKSAGRSGDIYYRGTYDMQRRLYCAAAELATGHQMSSFNFHQLIKTKTPNVETYRKAPPTEIELDNLRQFLEYCQWRKNEGPRNFPYVSSCGGCRFAGTGKCEFE